MSEQRKAPEVKERGPSGARCEPSLDVAYLFIFGHLNGRRIAMRGRPTEVSMPWISGFEGAGAIPKVHTQTYRRMDIAGETKAFTVYALAGFNGDDVICALIDQYRGGPRDV